MDKFIAQKDEKCSDCDNEIPRGSWFYTDGFDFVQCQDCYDLHEQEDPAWLMDK